MKLFSQARSLLRGWRLLRAIVQQQEAQTALLAQIAVALASIATSQRAMAQAELGSVAGFTTGPPDGKEDSGLVRQSDQETFELLEMEKVLQRRLGRTPTDAETVAAWEEWRHGL